MASTGLISLSFKPGPNSAGLPRFEAIQRRLADLRPAGDAVIAAMRKGAAGQFSAQAEDTLTGSRMWKRSHDFGNRKAPANTLDASGKLKGAWTGSAGATSRVTENSFAIGVDTGIVPYAAIFQSQTPTLIKPKSIGHSTRAGKLAAVRRGRPIRYAMFWKLGLTFGVWMSQARLEQGFLIQPRRVGVGRSMLTAVKGVLVGYVTGRGASGARAAA